MTDRNHAHDGILEGHYTRKVAYWVFVAAYRKIPKTNGGLKSNGDCYEVSQINGPIIVEINIDDLKEEKRIHVRPEGLEWWTADLATLVVTDRDVVEDFAVFFEKKGDMATAGYIRAIILRE